MTIFPEQISLRATLDCLTADGELGALMRARDWTQTALGPVEHWPSSLQNAVCLCLNAHFPLFIWWGPERVLLYNDACRAWLGPDNHPRALGQCGRASWPEAWPMLEPLISGVWARGAAASAAGQLPRLDGAGDLADSSISFSCSPLRDELGQVGGVFCALTEPAGPPPAQAAVDASQERPQQTPPSIINIIHDAPFGVYLVDAQLRFVHVSASAQKVFGHMHPLIGRDLAEVVRVLWPEPFATEVLSHFRQTLATGEPYHSPISTEQRGDVAETESYEWQIERVSLPDGQAGVVCYFQDITERQRAEQLLRDSERRWSLLARLGDATRSLHDPREIVLAAMRILREYLGADRCAWAEVEADENHFSFLGDAVAPGVPSVTGRYPVSAFGEEALRVMRAGRPFACADALTELPAQADREAYRATGIRALIATPIHQGGRFVAGTGVHMRSPRVWTAEEIKLVQDVTERCSESIARARSERALRASEERYRAVVNNQVEMLCRFRTDGEILFVNAAYARARGAAPEDLIGRNFWDFIPPEERPAIQAMLRRLTPGSPEIQIENRFATTERELWTLWTNVGLVFDAEGRVTEAQASGIDITERKRMEEALREADRRKDEFLAMLAHELRNPLAPIRNATQVLKLVGPLDVQVARAHEIIERQTQHLTKLVDDLLDVSRITQGKVRLTREPLDVAVIINRAIEVNLPLLEARRHQLTLVLPPDPLRVEGDLTRLIQVVGNLLNNAAKYTDEGGHLRVTAAEENGEAVIRVRDNGAGLPPDLLPHVFDLFTQADRSLDRSQGGLGIGLTLVQRLVELHGGRVEAHSAGLNQGSEFSVRLPTVVAHATPGVGEAAASGAQPLRRKLRVLVVEDNADSAEMMAFMLELNGHEVHLAGDGLEALHAARVWQPQVILCDIGLPKLNGYEVAAQLREQPEFQQTRIIALSGYGQEEDRRRAHLAGFDYHLTKPVEPEILDALLESLWSHDPGT